MSVQNKELFQKFVEFCDAQPKDKEINHESWESCAVGDWVRFDGISLSPIVVTPFFDGGISPEVLEILPELTGWDETLGDDWEDQYSPIFKYLSALDLPSNYGEFTKQLKTYL